LYLNKIFLFVNSKSDIGNLTEYSEDSAGGPPGLELLQHLQGDATTIVEKERKLSEMILQLQLFREQLLTQQDHSTKVIFSHHIIFADGF